jgi:hypothetical protein
MRRSHLILACAAASALLTDSPLAQGQSTPWQSGHPLAPHPPLQTALPPRPSAEPAFGGSGQAVQFGATTAAPGTSQPAPEDPSVTGQAPTPGLNILGVPVTVAAPVAAPYSNSAYGDFGGQPQLSGDGLLNWRRDRD